MRALGVVGVVPAGEGRVEAVTAVGQEEQEASRFDGTIAVEAAPEGVVRERVDALACGGLRVRAVGGADERRGGGLANASG